eukprot:scaffold3079_cov187-Ochromonas_danica.AAC.14
MREGVTSGASTYTLGPNDEYTVLISGSLFNPLIAVNYRPTLGRITGNEIWSTVPDKAFITVGLATFDQPPILNGNYQVNYTLTPLSSKIQIGEIIIIGDEHTNALVFLGSLTDDNEIPVGTFNLTLWVVDNFNKIDKDNTIYTSLEWSISTTVDHDNIKKNQAVKVGDDYSETEIHTTFVYASRHWESFFGFGESFSLFNLTGLVVPVLVSEQGVGRGMEPITDYLNEEIGPGSGGYTGRQTPLPTWTQKGAIVGLEGGTANVTAIVSKLLAGGVPIAAVWLQDWVGMRHSWDGDRLVWNWELNEQYYPNWQNMIQSWQAKGIRVLTYLNPFFSDPTNFTQVRNNYYKEGLAKDLTNPAARAWMKEIIINETLLHAGSSGWMGDFGEYLPFDAKLSTGQRGNQYHNYYPEAWAALQAEIVSEYPDRELMFFARSAWVHSPKYTPAFWLGDQLQAWDPDDGMASVILGALSSGLCGHAITHSDLGGYNAENGLDDGNPDMIYLRSDELLKRWVEMGAFGFGLFRTHIGSSQASTIAQIYDNSHTIAHFAEFAHIFANLSNYRIHLMEEARDYGYPLIRPMVMYFATENEMWGDTEQYMFGSDFLIAPVLYSNSNYTFVDIPGKSGTWVHLWGGNLVHNTVARFMHLRVPTPMGFPAVFYRQGSTYGNQLRAYVISKGYTAGYVWPYDDTQVFDDDQSYDPIETLTLSEKILVPLFFALMIASLIWLFIAFYHETLEACFPACCAGDDQETVYLNQSNRRVEENHDLDNIPKYVTKSSSTTSLQQSNTNPIGAMSLTWEDGTVHRGSTGSNGRGGYIPSSSGEGNSSVATSVSGWGSHHLHHHHHQSMRRSLGSRMDEDEDEEVPLNYA